MDPLAGPLYQSALDYKPPLTLRSRPGGVATGGVILIATTEDPSTRRLLALVYVGGMLNNIGALIQATLGTLPGIKEWGLSGSALVASGLIGFVDGFIFMGLGIFYAERRRPSWAGKLILVLAIASVVTSFFGGFVAGAVTSGLAGYSMIKLERNSGDGGTITSPGSGGVRTTPP